MSTEKDRAVADALDRIGIALGKLAAALADHEHRIDALERRIERIDGMLDGMGRGAAARIEAMERRIAAIERKLAHKTREAE